MPTTFTIFKQNTDAPAANLGFNYQYLATLAVWLNNYDTNNDTEIYCEKEEDILQENKSTRTKIFTQLKCYSSDFNLNSEAIKGSLINFYKLFLDYKNNPNFTNLKFVFETNTSIKKEESILPNWETKIRPLNTVILQTIKDRLKQLFTEYIDEKLSIYTTDSTLAHQIATSLKNSLETSDFEKFINIVYWEFKGDTPQKAINAKKTFILNTIDTLPHWDKNISPELIMGYLFQHIVDCSGKPNENDRVLTNEKLEQLLNNAQTKDTILKTVQNNTWEILDNLQILSTDIQYLVLREKKRETEEQQYNQAWLNYYNETIEEYQQPIFNNEKGLSLKEIYIEPTIQFYMNNLSSELQEDEDFSTVQNYTNAHQVANSFLKRTPFPKEHFKTTNPRIFLLLGQAGQGKTSFCRRFCFDNIKPQLLKENKIFLIKLRYIESIETLFNDPLNTLYKETQTRIGDTFFSKTNFAQFTLILDGLDELSMKAGVTTSDINKFLVHLAQLTEQGSPHQNMRIIITSRYYLDLYNLKNSHNILIASLDYLTIKQQEQWLNVYRKTYTDCTLTIEKLREINNKENHQYQSLRELINQPVLLYLVADANINLEAQDTTASIYDKLFTILCQRSYDNNQQIASLRGLTPKILRKYVADIALAIFHSPNGYICKADLEKLDSANEFKKAIQADSIKIFEQVMLAFYMKQVTPNPAIHKVEDGAIEFLHKSLQEYLAAEKMLNELLKIIVKTEQGDYIYHTEFQILEIIENLFAPKQVSEEIEEYLIQRLVNLPQQQKEELFNRLHSYLDNFCDCQFLTKIPKQQNPIQTIFSIFFSYWKILRPLSNEEIVLNDSWIYLLQLYSISQFKNNYEQFYVNLSNTSSIFKKLKEIHFFNSNFSNSQWYHSEFINCHFNFVSFSSSIVKNTIFFNTHFFTVSFKNIELDKNEFRHCSFTNLIMENLNFSHTDFQSSSFYNVAFINTNLNGVDFKFTKFEKCTGLTTEILSKVECLYEAKGIPQEIINELHQQGFSHLFEKPKNDSMHYFDTDDDTDTE